MRPDIFDAAFGIDSCVDFSAVVVVRVIGVHQHRMMEHHSG